MAGLVVALVAGLAVARDLPSALARAERQKDLVTLEQRLEELRRGVVGLRGQATLAGADVTFLEDEVSRARARLRRARHRVEAVRERLADLEQRLGELGG